MAAWWFYNRSFYDCNLSSKIFLILACEWSPRRSDGLGLPVWEFTFGSNKNLESKFQNWSKSIQTLKIEYLNPVDRFYQSLINSSWRIFSGFIQNFPSQRSLSFHPKLFIECFFRDLMKRCQPLLNAYIVFLIAARFQSFFSFIYRLRLCWANELLFRLCWNITLAY